MDPVICDFFSKFVLVQCMKTATTPGVCTVMENLVFNLFGAPSVCITDNAKVFQAEMFRKLLADYGATQWNLAVYHPSPNPAERVNRVIVTAIRCALNRQTDHRNWYESVHKIAAAIRTNAHESTGLMPYLVNFGHNMISTGTEYEYLRDFESENEYDPSHRPIEVRKLYDIVRQNLHSAYQRYSRPYNLRANSKHTFSPGDIVYKRDMHLSDKGKHFVGKFGTKYSRAKIQTALGTNTFVLEDEKGHRIPGTYHGSFLKKA